MTLSLCRCPALLLRKTMVMLITMSMISSAPAAATETDAATAALGQRMGAVIVAELPVAKAGQPAGAQFLMGLEQLSDAYEKLWHEPLPVYVELAALRELRKDEERLSGLIGPYLKDVPLKEALRGWCMLAGLQARIADGRVLVSVAAK